MIRLADMADFRENINPIDRRKRLIAKHLSQHGFEITPLRNLARKEWIGIPFKKFDIFHARGWQIEKHLLKIINYNRLILTIHGIWDIMKKDIKLKKMLCKKADVIHILYSISKKVVIDRYHGMEEKIRLIYNPIDINLFHPEEHHNERLKVLFVSSYIERKKPQIVAELAKEFPEMDFYMYGSHAETSLYENIYNESKKLKNLYVNKAIDYYKLPPVYKNADIFLFPSIQGEFGNVVIEAMSSGLPVVAMEKGAEEIIEHGSNGLLYENEEEIREHLQYLADNEKERIRMGNNSRITAIKKFSQEKIFKQYLDMYKN